MLLATLLKMYIWVTDSLKQAFRRIVSQRLLKEQIFDYYSDAITSELLFELRTVRIARLLDRYEIFFFQNIKRLLLWPAQTEGRSSCKSSFTTKN